MQICVAVGVAFMFMFLAVLMLLIMMLVLFVLMVFSVRLLTVHMAARTGFACGQKIKMIVMFLQLNHFCFFRQRRDWFGKKTLKFMADPEDNVGILHHLCI